MLLVGSLVFGCPLSQSCVAPRVYRRAFGFSARGRSAAGLGSRPLKRLRDCCSRIGSRFIGRCRDFALFRGPVLLACWRFRRFGSACKKSPVTADVSPARHRITLQRDRGTAVLVGRQHRAALARLRSQGVTVPPPPPPPPPPRCPTRRSPPTPTTSPRTTTGPPHPPPHQGPPPHDPHQAPYPPRTPPPDPHPPPTPPPPYFELIEAVAEAPHREKTFAAFGEFPGDLPEAGVS